MLIGTENIVISPPGTAGWFFLLNSKNLSNWYFNFGDIIVHRITGKLVYACLIGISLQFQFVFRRVFQNFGVFLRKFVPAPFEIRAEISSRRTYVGIYAAFYFRDLQKYAVIICKITLIQAGCILRC